VSLTPSSETLALSRSLLTEAEQARADRRVAPADKAQLRLSRLAFRCAIAGQLRARPEEIELTVRPGGQPVVRGVAEHVSLSRSGDMAAIAIAGRPVGVDVEVVTPDLAAAIGRPGAAYFSARERRLLTGLPATVQSRAIARCWTRKEAMVKALGCGLSAPLVASFEVGVWPIDTDAGPRWRPGGPSARWRLADIPTPPNFVVSAAVARDCGALTWRSVTLAELTAGFANRARAPRPSRAPRH
jgi:4'-phosphopantetheinyl transferase